MVSQEEMDQIERDGRDTASVQSNNSNAIFDFQPIVQNNPVLPTQDTLLNPVYTSTADNNLAFSNYGSPYPPFNLGFNVESLEANEQFTEQDFAALDDYLNRLSQQSLNGLTSTSPLSSSSCSPPLPNGTATSPNNTVGSAPLNPFNYNDHFNQAAASGRQFYQDALHQWSTVSPAYSAVQQSDLQQHSPVYNPFGASGFTYVENNPSPPLPSTQPTVDQIQLESPNPVKPSFADVAKNKPSSKVVKKPPVYHRASSPKTNVDPPNSEHRNNFQSSTSKLKKLKCVRGGTRKAKSFVPVTPTEIKPDSRYGLDSFDDAQAEKENKSLTSRKNSNSSVASSSMSTEDKGSASINARADKPHKNKVPTEDKTLFFDPRRIFQDSPVRARMSSNNDDFVPNNKQKIQTDKDKDKVKASVKGGTTKYINNDLRDTKKDTNVEFEQVCEEHSDQEQDSGDHKRPDKDVAKSKQRKADVTNNGSLTKERASRKQWSGEKTRNMIGEWLVFCATWFVWLMKAGYGFVHNLVRLIRSVLFLLFVLILHYLGAGIRRCWIFISTRFDFRDKNEPRFDWSKDLGSPRRQKQLGLKENIVLPSTGDEAMKRLLSCKGKDPYSILGVKGDATDDDIKKYYRKQAFLVHPDKNKQPGAEESFKILGHAFDLIGTPEKRKEYDSQFDKTEAEAAMEEFSDLLNKLNEKMQEAANLLRCDHCGGKHKRIPTERPMYGARFCDRCNVRHPAKEGDVWAETTKLGFLWHYYACMEGKIFNITAWAKCKRENFKSLQANAHQVIYRLTTAGARARHQSRTGEADLDDFLNTLFHHTTAMPPDASGAQASRPTTQTAASKKSRKKKKKH